MVLMVSTTAPFLSRCASLMGMNFPVPALRPIFLVAMDEPSNVVPFRAFEKGETQNVEHRQMWVCSCGCLSFRLFDNGYIQCAQCGVWLTDGQIHWNP